MFNKIIIILVWIAIGIAIIWVGGFLVLKNNANKSSSVVVSSGALDVFARCLSDSGVKMYGASWCPHCQNQKKLFGSSFNFIKYTECADPENPNRQTQACSDAGIAGYPTWIFSDGQRLEGEATLQQLAGKSGCAYK